MENQWFIPEQPEMQDLNELHSNLLEWVENQTTQEEVQLDLDGDAPNQPALQLLVATDCALRKMAIRVAYGKNASRVLDLVIQNEEQ